MYRALLVVAFASALPAAAFARDRATSGGADLAALNGAVLAAKPTAAKVEAHEPASAQPAPATSDAELAKQLSNPVSSLISVPFQSNYDCCFGPQDGWRYTLNIQPVVPLGITRDWNLIVRTILPIIGQSETSPTQSDEIGLGDTTQSFFFSPKQSGLIWGVGPAFLYPTGTSGFSSRQWAAGPTGVLLKQQGGNTYGILANQLWSFAGDDDRPDVNAMFLQPFYTYTYPNSTTAFIDTESTYDWEAGQWTVPVNFGVSHVFRWGPQRVSVQALARYYLERPEDGPEWGARLNVTLLYPK